MLLLKYQSWCFCSFETCTLLLPCYRISLVITAGFEWRTANELFQNMFLERTPTIACPQTDSDTITSWEWWFCPGTPGIHATIHWDCGTESVCISHRQGQRWNDLWELAQQRTWHADPPGRRVSWNVVTASPSGNLSSSSPVSPPVDPSSPHWCFLLPSPLWKTPSVISRLPE